MPVKADLTDLHTMKAHLRIADPDNRLGHLGMSQLLIAPDAYLGVGDAVAAAAGDAASNIKVVVLKDTTPIMRDGADLKHSVEALLRARFHVTPVALGKLGEKLHVSETILEAASNAVADADIVVTVGSGSITDIGKVACSRHDNRPLIAVQSAASVDGFTDDVSVVLRQGVKRTIPSCWPYAVLADVVTIAGAPESLNKSGFGEALSMFTAPADWYLASIMGLDDTFHQAALDIFAATGGGSLDWSQGIATGDTDGVDPLVRLLAVRGIVAGITRTTACLSGVEHVISHMLDMYQAANGKSAGLHGAQVGVGSIVAGVLWHRAINEDLVVPSRLTLPSLENAEREIIEAFGDLDDSGALASECLSDYRKKHQSIQKNWGQIEAVVTNWAEHAARVKPLVRPGLELRDALIASGSPATFPDLDPPLASSRVRWAIRNCHLMRNRFNLVDLMSLLGLWDGPTVDALVGLVDGSAHQITERQEQGVDRDVR